MGSGQGGEILISKKLICSDASCIKGILQALCHILEIALYRGFEAHEQGVGCTASHTLLNGCCWANTARDGTLAYA
jgi:hypothetical protein